MTKYGDYKCLSCELNRQCYATGYGCMKENQELEEKDKEIERLNNIINETREYLTNNAIFDINDKGVNKTMLSMLRGSDKE